MSQPLEYKGYKGEYAWVEEDQIFFGEVIGITDVVTFQGDAENDIEQAFHDSVDDYIEFCKEREEKRKENYAIIFDEWDATEDGVKRNIGMEILDGLKAIKEYKDGNLHLNTHHVKEDDADWMYDFYENDEEWKEWENLDIEKWGDEDCLNDSE